MTIFFRLVVMLFSQLHLLLALIEFGVISFGFLSMSHYWMRSIHLTAKS